MKKDKALMVGVALALGTICAARVALADVTGIESWRSTQFGVNASNAAIAGDNADPDADGIKNLMEYALGTDPNVASPTGMPAVAASTVGGVDSLTLTYKKLRPDILYTVEKSDDMQSWSSTPDVMVGTDSGAELHQAPVPRDGTQKFLRLTVAVVSLPNTPAAPSGLTATTVSTSQINLSWADNSGTGFKIERKTGAGGTYAQIATVAAGTTTYNNTGLSTATSYYYQVRATNANGDSGFSPEANATTLDVTPAAPGGLTLGSVTSNSITLNWADNSNGATGNETGFKIERRTGAGSFAQIATVGANVTNYVDATVASVTSYGYRMRATNSGGDSGYSNVPTNVTTGGTAVTAPTNLTAAGADSNQMNLSWTDTSGNETGFIIERSPSGATGTFTPIGAVGAGVTSYQDTTGLTGFTTYYYRVRATINGGSNSSYTTANGITLLAAPTNFAVAVNSTTQVTLSWTDNSTGEVGFRVERKTGADGTYAAIVSAPANSTSYSQSGLTPDTLYFYRVRAGNTASTNSLFTPELPVVLVPTPVLTAAVISASQINLSWTLDSPNDTGTKIERKPDVGGSWAQIATTGAGVTTYSDSGLPASTTYIYRVRATTIGANDSLYSNQANATTSIGVGLPSPWLDQDIGAVGTVGSAGYSGGAFTIKGSGADIWGTADSFHYVYRSLNGNGTIVARLVNMDKTNAWAKAGVMIRETLDAGSKHAAMVISPSYSNGSMFYSRSTTDGASVGAAPNDGVAAPYWIKLVRSEDSITGFKSSDGSTWVFAGSASISMVPSVFVGMPVCSKTPSICRALMDNVTVTEGSVPAIPAAPANLVLNGITSSSIQVNWSDTSSNETGFSIERKTGSGGAFAEIATVGAGATSYNNTGLATGTYFYRVRAYNAGGYSDYTTTAGAGTTGAPVPSLFSQGSAATASSGDASLADDGDFSTAWQPDDAFPQSWKVDFGSNFPITKVVTSWYFPSARWYKYKIETSTDDITYTLRVDKSNNTTIPNGDITDVFSATARYLRITVLGSNATSSPKTKIYECRVYRNGSEPAAATSLVASSVTANRVNLSWTDNSTNETGFEIERKTGNSASTNAYALIATVGPGVTTYQDPVLAAGTQYTYRVMATSTTDGDALSYSNTITATTTTAGSLTRQYWTGITGGDVSDLTTNSAYIANTPTGSGTLNIFEAPQNWGDSFGEKISGQVHPPTTGDYTFYIEGDNSSELWLSTDSTEANAVLIAQSEDATGSREWARHARNAATVGAVQESLPVALVAGQSYYIKALHKEGTNSDHVAVAWKGPGFSRQVMSDSGLPLLTSITSPADGAQIAEGTNITINANATAASGRTIAKVEFILGLDTKNELKLGEDLTAPYSFTWNNVAAGSYVLMARAWDSAGVSATTSVKVLVTNATFGSGTWSERILNGDGTINWTEYANVANSYDSRSTAEYRFGPSYAYYHPVPDAFPTLMNQSGEDGIVGHAYVSGNTDWYSEGGQMVFSPNPSAPSKYQPSVAMAWNGDVYPYDNGGTPPYCFVNGLQWNNEDGHGQRMPDASVIQPAFIAANGGTVPPPIASVRTRGTGGITGFLLFKNGFITAAGNSTQTDGYHSQGYAFTQLAAGKVPTAGAITLNNEFLLVTVWDTINHKGQIAVLSNDGQLRAQQSANNTGKEEYFWGLPSRFKVRAMKVLGYIDLPFAAPTDIDISTDVFKDGIGFSDNSGLGELLNSQPERDNWYNWTGGDYKKIPRSGYAVVSSRAENKVAFFDLQPLFEYYRKMYFTTQANYDLTKNQGPAPDQWPFTFGTAPEQAPTLYATLDLTNPTALMAGPPINPNGGNGTTNGYRTNAYIATMDGKLRIYNVGDLMTTASGGSISSPSATISIGKNPTSIDNNVEWRPGTVVNCRGDKAIYLFDPAGVIISTLKDSRIQDPIYAALSQNGRGTHGINVVHVMDFEGAQIQTYRYGFSTAQPPITEPQGFEFTHTDPLPGCPIMYTRCGVN